MAVYTSSRPSRWIREGLAGLIGRTVTVTYDLMRLPAVNPPADGITSDDLRLLDG